MAKEIKISIRNLYKSFGKKKVLDGVDLDVETEFHLIMEIMDQFKDDEDDVE